MRYCIQYAKDVRPFLWNLPLSREGKIKVWTFIFSTVARVSDGFRSDPANRPLGRRTFHMQLVFTDAGRVRTLGVYVDDSSAAYGVLTIAFADCS